MTAEVCYYFAGFHSFLIFRFCMAKKAIKVSNKDFACELEHWMEKKIIGDNYQVSL